MATLIVPRQVSEGKDKQFIPVQPKNGEGFELKELYQMIECDLVQVIPVQEGWAEKFASREVGLPGMEDINPDDELILIIDEEGKLKENHKNIDATLMFNLDPRNPIPANFKVDYIMGNAVLCKSEDFK